MPDQVEITLTVNGTERMAPADCRTTLADFLRDHLGLTGTHLGCEHGVCGACTVLLGGESVRSCLMLAIQAVGHEVTTVEGLAGPGTALHPLQESFSETHALQCGFCTPGFLMAAVELLNEGTELDDKVIRKRLSGNLCRCTGYQNIVAAIELAARKMTRTSS